MPPHISLRCAIECRGRAFAKHVTYMFHDALLFIEYYGYDLAHTITYMIHMCYIILRLPVTMLPTVSLTVHMFIESDGDEFAKSITYYLVECYGCEFANSITYMCISCVA